MRIEGIIYRLRREGKSSFLAFIAIVKRIFYDNIPSSDIKDLPASYAFLLGSFVYIIILLAFSLLFKYGYKDDISQIYLSPTNDSGNCHTVPRTLSGTYLADSEGRWESDPYFEYTKAIYSFTFSGFRGSYDVYKESLSLALDYVAALGERAYSQNLATNIVQWVAASGAVIAGESSNTFLMSGSPKVLFDKLTYYAAFSDVSGVCPVHAHTSYDSGSATLRLEFSYSDFMANSTCKNIVKPEHMGYNSKYNLDNFAFTIDAQTLLTALAINTDALSVEELEVVPETLFQFDYKNQSIVLGKYFYPRYPGMKPLFCAVLSQYRLLCTIQYFNLYFYPIFNHAGYSPVEPHYCSCDDPAVGQSEGCNLFNFIAGFSFYDYDEEKGETEYDAIYKLVEDTLGENFNAEVANADAFNASFDAAVNENHFQASSPSWRYDAYSFCRLTDGSSCSMLSVLLTDGYTFDANDTSQMHNMPNKVFTISNYYYQLTHGSCNDSFTISSESNQRLTENTPQPLSESYYECSPSKSNAAINAWGIATSNAAMLSPLVVTCILLAFAAYNSSKKREVARTYSAGERADVLTYFAFNLLLARDGHYKGAPDDVVVRLRDELGAQESIHRFFSEKKVTSGHSENDKGDDSGDIELWPVADNGAKSEQPAAPPPELSDFDKMPNPLYIKPDGA